MEEVQILHSAPSRARDLEDWSCEPATVLGKKEGSKNRVTFLFCAVASRTPCFFITDEKVHRFELTPADPRARTFSMNARGSMNMYPYHPFSHSLFETASTLLPSPFTCLQWHSAMTYSHGALKKILAKHLQPSVKPQSAFLLTRNVACQVVFALVEEG